MKDSEKRKLQEIQNNNHHHHNKKDQPNVLSLKDNAQLLVDEEKGLLRVGAS